MLNRILILFLIAVPAAQADRLFNNKRHNPAQSNQLPNRNASEEPSEAKMATQFNQCLTQFNKVNEPALAESFEEEAYATAHCATHVVYPAHDGSPAHESYEAGTTITVIRPGEDEEGNASLVSINWDNESRDFTKMSAKKIEALIAKHLDPLDADGSAYTNSGSEGIGLFFDCAWNNSRFANYCQREIRPHTVGKKLRFALHEVSESYDLQFTRQDAQGNEVPHNIQEKCCY